MTSEEERRYRTGAIVGEKYVLERPLGAGGVAEVWEARNSWTARRVAIKLLRPELASDGDVVRRFVLEAQATTRLAHPNIVDVLDMGQEPGDGALYLVTELLRGIDLRTHLNQRGRLAPIEALEIMVPILGALAVAHRHGVVHRDVKPENILLARDDEGHVTPTLIDFGFSKLLAGAAVAVPLSRGVGRDQLMNTAAGIVVGTPEYMSPEQVRGQPVSPSMDIWAAGIVLYELITGAVPFHAATMLETLFAVLRGEAPRLEVASPGLPQPLCDAIHRALAPDPSARFATMNDLLAALLACAPQLGEPGRLLPVRHQRSLPDLSDAAATARAIPSAEVPAAPSVPPRANTAANARPTLDDVRAPPLAMPATEPTLKGPGTPAAPATIAPVGDEPESAPSVREAEQDLANHALEHAFARAENALARGDVVPAVRGALRLVQARARNWQGRHGTAQDLAAEALHALPRGSARWYHALGEWMLAGSVRGRIEVLVAAADDLARIRAQGPVGVAHRVALCRLALAFVRAGSLAQARATLADARAGEAPGEASTTAWFLHAQSALWLADGYLSEALGALEAAAQAFTALGNLRNACLARATAGALHCELGAWRDAAAVLARAVRDADSMGLFLGITARPMLALALARRGAAREAREAIGEALGALAARDDPALAAHAHLHAAMVLAAGNDLAGAEREAGLAEHAAKNISVVRARAFALLADLALLQHPDARPLALAQKAVLTLAEMPSGDPGEALIRLVYARTLARCGARDPAREAIRLARARILARAERISAHGQKQSFLYSVPEHAQTLALANEWLDG